MKERWHACGRLYLRQAIIMFDLFGKLTYALEYAFGIKNVFLAILVVSATAAVLFSMAGWILKNIVEIYMVVILCGAILVSFGYMNPLLSNLPEYVPRLGMILENAGFILGVEQNMETLYDSLGIEKNGNEGRVEQVVYLMSEEEWDKAIDDADSMAWYLRRIEYSLNKTISIPGTSLHLERAPVFQGFWGIAAALIPFALSFLTFTDNKRLRNVMCLYCTTCMVVPLGTAIYLDFYLVFCWAIVRILLFFHGKKGEKGEQPTTGSPGETGPVQDEDVSHEQEN